MRDIHGPSLTRNPPWRNLGPYKVMAVPGARPRVPHPENPPSSLSHIALPIAPGQPQYIAYSYV